MTQRSSQDVKLTVRIDILYDAHTYTSEVVTLVLPRQELGFSRDDSDKLYLNMIFSDKGACDTPILFLNG
jgi:hypothetical protein